MKWITHIAISNYRAFGEPVQIDIPRGHHLLVYGENGSGKSSLYHALKDFFDQANPDRDIEFRFNEFKISGGEYHGGVNIGVDEEEFFWSSEADVIGYRRYLEPDMHLASKVKGFLDYKALMPIHALTTPRNKRHNLFALVMRDLLAHHYISDPAGGVGGVEILHEYRELKKALLNNPRHSKIYKEAEEKLNRFNVALAEVLKRIEEYTNSFLNNYFKNKLSLSFDPKKIIVEPASKNKKKHLREELFFNVFYAGKEIPNYHAFLNEARLSALALCLFLASLKTYPLAASPIRVLFLDDVFIGLDTGNRMPLLEILKTEFIQGEYPFQLFISTYDRGWFELARQWFVNNACQFKAIELYIDDDGNPNTPDYPVIIDPSRDYFGKAQAFFAIKDYPSAATHLRKACEQEIRRILPRHLTLQENKETGEVKRIDILDTLVNHLMGFLVKNGLDTAPFRDFQTLKKIVLNPLSHDDLEAPHFRREIEASIELVKHLKAVKAKTIIDLKKQQDTPLKLGCWQYGTRDIHNYEFRLLENMQLLQHGDDPARLSKVECAVKELGGEERTFNSFYQAMDAIWQERGYEGDVDYELFFQNIKVSNKRKLIDLMSFD